MLLLLAAAFAAETPPWNINEPFSTTHTVNLDLREGTWMSVSAAGETLVFDLLGDIWSMPLAGGEARRLTASAAWDSEPRLSPDGKQIAYVSDSGGNENLWIMNVDGSGARAFTHEESARVTDPVWDPAGRWIVGRKRTVDTRSIGVTELWQYHLDGGSGIQLTSLDAHPHAGESVVHGRYIYFSSRAGRFEYSGNPVGGLWSVQRLDRVTGQIVPLVSGAGGAARPTLSPDGKQLAFVSRDREKTMLEVLDLTNGRRRVVGDWLDHDQMEGFALHAVYPAMSWLPDNTMVLWAKGQLWRVRLDSGERAAIPFHAQGSWTLHDVPRTERTVTDEVTAKVLRWPVTGPDGSVVVSAMGVLWSVATNGAVTRISPETGYSPAFGPDGTLAWTSWSDLDPWTDVVGGRLHLTKKGKTTTLPLEGQLQNPAWSADGQQIVVLRGPGGGTSPDLGAEPWYEIVLLTKQGKAWVPSVVTEVGNVGSARRATPLYIHDGRIWFCEDRYPQPRSPEEVVLVSVKPDGTDKREHLFFPAADEVAISPDFTQVAYKAKHQVWLTAMPGWSTGVKLGDGSLPTVQLTEVVGDWVHWSPDGRSLSWMEGPILRTLDVSAVKWPVHGEDPPKPPEATSRELKISLPRERPEGVLALTNAKVVTMNGDAVLDKATVVIERDRIIAVGADVAVPAGARVIDCTGKTIIPGLIDVHAHLHYSAGDVLPEQEWRYQTNLDFGVTTVHDPSASTDLVFTQAERVEAGLSNGPRVYSTGFVLYGALSNQGAETPDLDAARNHLKRLKAVGAISAKIYQQSQRLQRQWYAKACQELGMLCVAEGGGDLWQDLSMVADGYQAVEHALPNAPLYQDVLGFFGGSPTTAQRGSAYSPTLLVAYGGLEGEHYFYQHGNPLNDLRLLRHYPRRELDTRTWRLGMMAQDNDWNFQQVARDAAALLRKGVLVTLGAHGQLQGLGPHWELWGLAGPGAMTPQEALQAATINGARYLGLDKELGSIEKGKLADMVVLDADPLADIHNTTQIALVIKNGEIWEEQQ